jgi:hypothetical protein
MNQDIDERLRAALSARADLVTADSLRPQPLSNSVASVRPRWRRPVIVLATGLLALVTFGAVVVDVRWQPDGGPTVQPASTSLDGVTFAVPKGWTYGQVAEGIGCFRPATMAAVDGACTPAGSQIQVGTFVGWPRNALDRDEGWSGTLGDCQAAGYPYATGDPAVQRLVTRSVQKVGDGLGDYRVWQVRCGSDAEFSVRLWWRADVSLTIYTVRLDPRYDKVMDDLVASVRTRGR